LGDGGIGWFAEEALHEVSIEERVIGGNSAKALCWWIEGQPFYSPQRHKGL
jgi:hypothetical protein